MRGGYFKYWGKACPSGQSAPFHLLPFHSLDVAAVGAEMLERDHRLLRRPEPLSGFSVLVMFVSSCRGLKVDQERTDRAIAFGSFATAALAPPELGRAVKARGDLVLFTRPSSRKLRSPRARG
jgi:hypothetical protein